MTDLLTRPAGRDAAADPAPRPLGLTAAVAGAVAATVPLLVCMALGLVGWFGSQAGAFGDTRDALRVGADAWLLAHGSALVLPGATVTVVPLGLTAICAYVVHRTARWAGARAVVPDIRTAVLGGAVLAGIYGVVTTAAAVLASLEDARLYPGRAFLGGCLLALVAGAPGIVAGSGRWVEWRSRVPEAVRCTGVGAVGALLLMAAFGAALVAGALLLDFGSAANVLARLHTDPVDGVLYTLVVAAFVPNAVLLAGSYLVGPGFLVGTGTLVSPSAVVLGPVPAFPLLAALPDDGPTPWWTTALVGLPVLGAAVAAVLALRRFPVPQYEHGAGRGLAVGVVAGLALGALTAAAGGSAGPGRMADVGALVGQTAMSAVVAMGVGGLLGGLAATFWFRRGRSRAADDDR